MRVRPISDAKNQHGRYNLKDYDNAPVYVLPTRWARLAPKGWVFWMLGKPIPGDGGRKYQPEGYRIEDVGPAGLVGKGLEQMKNDQERLVRQDCGGCPFAI